MQPPANARQILRSIDRPGALRGLLDPGVNRAHAQRHAKQVAQQPHHLAVRAVCDQNDRQREAPYPGVTYTGDRFDQQRRARLGKRQPEGVACALTLSTHELTPRAVPAGHGLRSDQRCDVDSLAGGGAQSTGARWGHGEIAEREQVAKLASITTSVGVPRLRSPSTSVFQSRDADHESGTLT